MTHWAIFEDSNMTKSEILQISSPDDAHTCAFEFVPHKERPREIYIRFDGVRIAARGTRLATGEPGWVPLVEGYEVTDEAALMTK